MNYFPSDADLSHHSSDGDDGYGLKHTGIRAQAGTILSLTIVVVSVLTAFTLVNGHRQREADAINSAHVENQLRMLSTLDHIESYLGGLYSDLRYISLDPNVKAMNEGSRDRIQALFDYEWENFQLSELYIIKRDFDGTRRPFMTFEGAPEEGELADVHSFETEAEEFRVQVEQIQRFIKNPTLRAQISREIELSGAARKQGSRGIVYSVPVFSGGEIAGMVAAMIPMQKISSVLERGNFANMVLLTNERGDLFSCEDMPSETRTWFEEQFEVKRVGRFFAEAGGTFRFQNWTAQWTPANITSGQRWWLASLFDEGAVLAARGMTSPYQGWWQGGIALALGLFLALLVKSTFNRLEERVSFFHEREQNRHELSRMHSFLDTVIHSIPDAVLVVDRDYNVLLANEAVRKMNDGADPVAAGLHCYEVAHRREAPCEEPDGPCPFSLVAETKQSVRGIHTRVTEEGETRYTEVTSSPIFDELGEVVQMVEICRDITEQRQAEEQRRRMETRLLKSQKMESLSVMAGSIAHNFNNALMSVLGFLELALFDLPAAAKTTSNIKEAEKAAKRAAEMSRLMLTYVGQGKEVVETVNLSSLVERTLALLGSTVPGNITRSQSLAESNTTISGDFGQLQQLLMNLVANSIEAISSDEGRLSISTGTRTCDAEHLRGSYLHEDLPEGQYAVLEVSDTGCGMDEVTQARAFDPFFTTRFTGRGLGLAAVLGIVRGHGGAINVESQLGKGTTVEILFPLAEIADPVAALPPATEGDFCPEGTILVVDDDESVLEVGKETLKIAGFTVLTALDGRQAVELFRTHGDEIGCVILDLSMPGMDGYQVFAELRQIRGDVPIIISTGYSEELVEDRFSGKGLSGFIQKPYQLADLMDKIRFAMAQ